MCLSCSVLEYNLARCWIRRLKVIDLEFWWWSLSNSQEPETWLYLLASRLYFHLCVFLELSIHKCLAFIWSFFMWSLMFHSLGDLTIIICMHHIYWVCSWNEFRPKTFVLLFFHCRNFWFSSVNRVTGASPNSGRARGINTDWAGPAFTHTLIPGGNLGCPVNIH